MKRRLLLAVLWLSTPAFAALQKQDVTYHEGETGLQGYYVFDNTLRGPRPGILLVHDWMGLSDFTKERADALAKLGYAVFAADIFGTQYRPKNTDEAAAITKTFKGNRSLLRARAKAAFDQLLGAPQVDTYHVAAMGYCFGGTTALELGRSGAALNGIVTFHGGLDTPAPGDAKNIKAKILVLHGAADPFVPPQQVADFEKEMTDAGVDWQLIKYSGAVHAFAVPGAGNDPSKGAAYNASADQRSWTAMQAFFAELFPPRPTPAKR